MICSSIHPQVLSAPETYAPGPVEPTRPVVSPPWTCRTGPAGLSPGSKHPRVWGFILETYKIQGLPFEQTQRKRQTNTTHTHTYMWVREFTGWSLWWTTCISLVPWSTRATKKKGPTIRYLSHSPRILTKPRENGRSKRTVGIAA